MTIITYKGDNSIQSIRLSVSKKKSNIEFINLDAWEDFDLLAYIIENKLNINPIEKNDGAFSRFNRYRKGDLNFVLSHYEDFGNCIKLTTIDRIPLNQEIESLHLIANKILNFVKSNIKEYVINDYITLLLKGKVTYIVIKGYIFRQCIGRYMFIPINEEKLSEIKSIDEAVEKFDIKKQGLSVDDTLITPKDEFWAHCSNIQAWVENDYDTRIIHYNLAFPLLERLSSLGDPLAKKVFKEEIAKRYKSEFHSVVKYLEEEGYLDYLTKEELEALK